MKLISTLQLIIKVGSNPYFEIPLTTAKALNIFCNDNKQKYLVFYFVI